MLTYHSPSPGTLPATAFRSALVPTAPQSKPPRRQAWKCAATIGAPESLGGVATNRKSGTARQPVSPSPPVIAVGLAGGVLSNLTVVGGDVVTLPDASVTRSEA